MGFFESWNSFRRIRQFFASWDSFWRVQWLSLLLDWFYAGHDLFVGELPSLDWHFCFGFGFLFNFHQCTAAGPVCLKAILVHYSVPHVHFLTCVPYFVRELATVWLWWSFAWRYFCKCHFFGLPLRLLLRLLCLCLFGGIVFISLIVLGIALKICSFETCSPCWKKLLDRFERRGGFPLVILFTFLYPGPHIVWTVTTWLIISHVSLIFRFIWRHLRPNSSFCSFPVLGGACSVLNDGISKMKCQ